MRFPEFKGEWKKATLEEVSSFSKGNGISKEEISKTGHDCVLYGELYTDFSLTTQIDQPILKTELKLKKPVVSIAGQVLIPASGETHEDISNAVTINKAGVWLGGDLNIISPKSGLFGPFLACYFRGVKKREIGSLAQGDSVVHLNCSNISKILISYPSEKEQKKIALIIRLIEKRIEVQRKIIEEKEQLKRWVNNACLWNKDFPKVALNKIIKERNLRTTTVHQYQVLSSAVTGLYSQMDYFKHQISSENDVGYKVVLLNDVVFSPQNLWMGNINFNESFEIGMVSPSYKVYSVNDGFVPFYLSLFLKTARMKYEYSVCSEQGASVVRRNLNEDEFLQIAIPMPDFKTQAAAAKKLKLIVKTIEIEKQCLEALTKEKSFLLSNLFI